MSKAKIITLSSTLDQSPFLFVKGDLFVVSVEGKVNSIWGTEQQAQATMEHYWSEGEDAYTIVLKPETRYHSKKEMDQWLKDIEEERAQRRNNV